MSAQLRPPVAAITLIASLVAVFLPARAEAQIAFELLGNRALGMAGAFVAVADDPNAGFWNPAGMVKGPLASLTIEANAFHFRDQKQPPVPGAGRLMAQSVAFGAWPVGVSFASVQVSALKKDDAGGLQAVSLRTTQYGFTVLQSIGDLVVVGGTVKYVRGSAAFGPASGDSVKAALDVVDDISAGAHGTFDFDVGVLAGTDRLRAGLTFKNLRRPGFAAIGGKPIFLERRARIGLAAFPRDGVTLAIDVDLDTADPLVGLRRTIAFGGETRLGGRFALRGGIRLEQGAAAQPIGALGGSMRLRPGFWLDGYVTRGRSEHQGIGLALRAGS